MIEPGEHLSESDLEALAELHVASIDDSLPTLLGAGFARSFYRFASTSASEWTFVERSEGRIRSACLVSLDPETLYSRVLRATFASLCGNASRAIFTSRAFRAWLVRYLGERLRGEAGHQPPPEITYVFTAADERGGGRGRRVVERAEAFLAERGARALHVKTLDDPANRALAFYDRHGFSRVGVRTEGGRRFIAFRKELAATPAPKSQG